MWDVLSGVAKMTWDVMSGLIKTAWDVMSGLTKTAWDVMSGVANLCGMFCPGWQKMAWDVLSRDVLSGSHCLLLESKQTQIYMKWAPCVKTCLWHLQTTKTQISLRSLISAIVIHKCIEKYHI